jgi:hypothetical protein
VRIRGFQNTRALNATSQFSLNCSLLLYPRWHENLKITHSRGVFGLSYP